MRGMDMLQLENIEAIERLSFRGLEKNATLDWLHDTGLVDLPGDDGTDAAPSADDDPA